MKSDMAGAEWSCMEAWLLHTRPVDCSNTKHSVAVCVALGRLGRSKTRVKVRGLIVSAVFAAILLTF